MENLNQYIESLIFASNKPVSAKDIKQTLAAYFSNEISKAEVDEALEQLIQKYKEGDSSFEIVHIAGGFQFMTKGAYHPIVSQYLRLESRKKLSSSCCSRFTSFE